ncbi:hypothetical protein PHSC3_000270 [Chlamydiales bacterium STE3]|nr:hypothetical protein PHSC3_000270 [Chlamydiales bacterium STE3]
MATDPRENLQTSYKTFSSRKWQKRKTAVAISMATCLFLGAIGYEIVREKETLRDIPKATTVLFPQESQYDHELIVRYNESLEKIHDLKKLLFLQRNSPPSAKVAELTAELSEKNAHVNKLADDLNTEREKNAALNLALLKLTDLIELQRNHDEALVSKLQDENVQLIAQHLAEEDLLSLNFEKHLHAKEMAFDALKAELDQERAAMIALYESKLFEEKKAGEELAQAFNKQQEMTSLALGKEKEDFTASVDKKIAIKEEEIEKLQKEISSVEELFVLKEQALQATESAWKDYALDLSHELQTLERDLAAKEEERIAIEANLSILEHKIGKQEKDAELQLAMMEELKENHDKLSSLYNALEETYLMNQLFFTYQDKQSQQNHLESIEQLTAELATTKEEISNINKALERETKAAESLFSEKSLYLTELQILKDYTALNEARLQELDRDYAYLLEELGRKNVELEEAENIFNLHLALNNQFSAQEISKAQVMHEDVVNLHVEKLRREVTAKTAAFKELGILQQQLEAFTAQLEKATTEIAILEDEKEKLSKSIDNQNIEFANYKTQKIEELEISQLASQHLIAQLQAAITQNDELQARSSQELDTQTTLVNQLEAQLKEAIAKNDELQTTSSQEFETKAALIDQLENQLKEAIAKNEELEATYQKDKSKSLQELDTQTSLVNQLEAQLKEAIAKQEELQLTASNERISFDSIKQELLKQIEAHKATLVQLESNLQEAHLKHNELQMQAEAEHNAANSKTLTLAQELEAHKQLIQDRENELAKAQSQHEAAKLALDADHVKLIEETNSYKQVIASLENQLDIALTRQELLQTHLNEEQQTFNNEKVQWMQEIDVNQVVATELENRLSEVSRHREELLGRLIEEQTTHSEERMHLQKEANSNKQAVANLENQHQELVDRYEDMRTRLTNEKMQLLEQNDMQKAVSKELEIKLEDTIAQYSSLEARLSVEEAKYLAEKAELESRLEKMRALADSEQLKYHELQLGLERIKKEFEQKLATNQEESQKLNQQILDLTTKEQETKEYLASYHSTINDTQALYKNRIDEMKSESELLARELEKMQEQNMQLKEKLVAEKSLLETQISHLDEEFKNLKLTKQKLEDELKEQLTSVNTLANDKQLLENQIAQLEISLSNKEQDSAQFLLEIAQLKEHLLKESLSLQGLIDEEAQQITYLNQKLEEKEKESLGALATIQSLQEELQGKNHSYDSLTQLLSEQKNMVVELQGALDQEIQKNKEFASEMSALQSSIREKEQLLIELSERDKNPRDAESQENLSALND